MTTERSTAILTLHYNRPGHTQRSLQSLMESLDKCIADVSCVYIICDGGKGGDDDLNVRSTRSLIKGMLDHWPVALPFVLIEHDQNLGLRKNVLRSVDNAFLHHDSLIVLEDDIIINQHTIDWFVNMLMLCESDLRIGSIQGYMHSQSSCGDFPIALPGADSWGWATWRSRWTLFREDFELNIAFMKNDLFRCAFNNGTQSNWFHSLRLTSVGKRDSWASSWRASLIRNGMASLYPPYSMVVNIGHDGSGEHCTINSAYKTSMPVKVPQCSIPEPLFDYQSYIKIMNFHQRENSISRRIFRRLKTILKNKSKQIFS